MHLRALDFQGTDRYQILGRIGGGSTGAVYEAYDRRKQTRVALKVLRDVQSQSLLRFKNEFRALHDLRHPNLVQLDELDVDGSTWFFTMELIKGSDLITYLASGAGATAPRPGLATAAPRPGLATAAPELVRRTFAELASGLCALHQAGKIYCDIKPSNVRVTREGRVVVLDFGLILETWADDAPTTQNPQTTMGTPAYAPPEQVRGEPMSTASDWYSVGTMLFQVLTGELPFAGTSMEMVLAKQRRAAPHPRELAPDCPAELAELCRDLLCRDPAARPGQAEILQRLGMPCVPRHRSASPVLERPVDSTPLFGRDSELAVLQAIVDQAQGGAPTAVLVTGESGVGKSALLRAFGRDKSQHAAAVVLASRCSERESVSYKAIDGVIDGLARYLAGLSAHQIAELLPRHAALLARVFPVLTQAMSQAPAPAYNHQLGDPRILRQRAFAALRELFALLTERIPVIVIIDDLQWSDADSIALLSELLVPPDAPPLLLLASWRTGDRAPPARLVLPCPVRELALEPLADEPASALAAYLLAGARDEGRAGATADPAHLAREARNHPLFIHELVRHAGVGTRHSSEPFRLNGAIWARIGWLEPEARQLIELLAVAGDPLPESVLGGAAGLPAEVLRQTLASLRVAHLARSAPGATEPLIEPYHGCIRDAVLEHLDAPRRRDLHGRLACAIEANRELCDTPLLTRHLAAAGMIDKATQQAERAAEKMATALAFDRAAELYRYALAGAGRDPQRSRAMRLTLAQMLVCAGRSAEAADLMEQAAEGAEPLQRIEYLGRAVEYLAVAWHLERGLRLLRTLLAEAHIHWPVTQTGTLASIAWHRARLRIRGLRWQPRDPETIAPMERARLKLHISAGQAASTFDPIRGMELITRGLLLALRLGEPRALGELLLMELSSQLSIDSNLHSKWVQKVQTELCRIIELTGAPLLKGGHALCTGPNGFHLGGYDRDVHAHFAELEATASHAAGVAFDLHLVRWHYLTILVRMGDVARLRERVAQYVSDGRASESHFAETVMGPMRCLAWLGSDEPEQAERDAAAAVASAAAAALSRPLYSVLESRALIAIYRDAAADRAAIGPLLRTTLAGKHGRMRWTRIRLLWLKGRLALSDALHAPTRCPALQTLRRCIRQLEREDVPDARVAVLVLRAGLAVHSDPRAAIAMLGDAAAVAQIADMHLFAQLARYRQGQLMADAAGASLMAAAAAWMAEQGVIAPDKMANLIIPAPPAHPEP